MIWTFLKVLSFLCFYAACGLRTVKYGEAHGQICKANMYTPHRHHNSDVECQKQFVVLVLLFWPWYLIKMEAYILADIRMV